ncbi:MAG: response regulator, partial [Abitibacteriaceae bacterium]|nr:response regulator [Abditibacteriaceae bacterium]
MILVQVIASTDFVAAISKLLLPLACVVCRLEPGQSPDANAVVIIYANTRVSVPYAKTYAATGAAAWLRHEGYTNPIVWLAGEPLELKTTPGDPIAHTSAQMDGGKIDLPWFAPLYDVALCLPQENGRLREAVQTAEGRIGKRRPLVEAAITRALQTHLESQGVYEDHLWKNLQAVLRFLRGAQCEWMIHPHDAQKIIKTIKRQVDLNATHPDFKAWAAEADSLLAKQTERWMNYKVAFVRLSRGTQVKPFAKMKRAGLPYRLLLVDDQWERLGWKVLLERLLAPYGFAVEADDGQSGAALEKRLKATKYDVVLLDLNLKSVPKLAKGERDSDDGKRTQESDDLTGLEHLKVFRQFAPQTPIIYFTSYERMSLERERQELGVLGYIVKQEDVSQQDARGYYKRLVELCHNTVDHEIRSLLRQLSQYWVERNPALYEEIGGRFDRSLKELDDPLITCHQSGLVYEGVLCDHLNMEFNKACREFGRLQGHSFSNWAMIGRLLRNAGAHRESGAEYLRLLDAHWSVFWATFVLIRLSDTGRSVGKINPCASERLVFLTLCRCHDVLKQVLGKYSYVLSALDLALSTRVLDKLDEANCELLDMALKFKHNPSQDLWPGFQQLTMLAGEVLLNASHSCCSRPGSDL